MAAVFSSSVKDGIKFLNLSNQLVGWSVSGLVWSPCCPLSPIILLIISCTLPKFLAKVGPALIKSGIILAVFPEIKSLANCWTAGSLTVDEIPWTILFNWSISTLGKLSFPNLSSQPMLSVLPVTCWIISFTLFKFPFLLALIISGKIPAVLPVIKSLANFWIAGSCAILVASCAIFSNLAGSIFGNFKSFILSKIAPLFLSPVISWRAFWRLPAFFVITGIALIPSETNLAVFPVTTSPITFLIAGSCKIDDTLLKALSAFSGSILVISFNLSRLAPAFLLPVICWAILWTSFRLFSIWFFAEIAAIPILIGLPEDKLLIKFWIWGSFKLLDKSFTAPLILVGSIFGNLKSFNLLIKSLLP